MPVPIPLRSRPGVCFAAIDELVIPAGAEQAAFFVVPTNETLAGSPRVSIGKICLP